MKGLCEELQSSGSVRVQLQSQLEQSARQREREVHSITVDRDNLHAKVSSQSIVLCLCAFLYQ